MFVCPECGATQPIAAPCSADGAPLVPIGDDVLLGQQIGAYRIARLLGIGGMGRVYKGVHPQIGSRVAIKVLSRECSDRRDLVDRFFAEAKVVNLIRHESIVNVLDLARLPDGRPYIVMEYLDGSPLSSIIEQAPHRGPLPLGGIARLTAEVLDALGAAHAKTIIHRDLKPDNIYVTPAGRAKVLDFGIAKLQPELGGSSTHTGSLMGTPHYMSPEQAAGRPVDARADIYAMGVILFELATLHKPFTASSLFDLLRMHVEAPPPSPRSMRPDMPAELEHVIYTALAKLPEQRFASAQAMSAALQHATSRLPSEAWSPILPAQSSSASGWQPTPPASWARNQMHNAPTQTAGQVTAGPTSRDSRRGKNGMWIALAATVLAGGGIAAAVIASSNNSGGGSGSAAAASGSGSSTGSGGVTSGSNVVVVEVPDDGVDLDPAIDQMIDQLPPEARAMLPAGVQAALKQYGSWSKVPKTVRAKLAPELALIGDDGVGLDVGNKINDALSGGNGDDGALTVPHFDPKHVDVAAMTTWALAEARKRVPDAELTWIGVDTVFPDGHADLTLKSSMGMASTLDFRFTSVAKSKRDPKIPRGVPQELKCNFRIWVEAASAEFRPMTSDGCKDRVIPKPRCSLKQVWQKALAKKKDVGDAVAQIYYTTNIVTLKVVWMFTIQDAGQSVMSEQFPDDC